MLSDRNPLLVFQIKLWRERIKPSIIKAFEISPDDKFDWAPMPGMITLGKLFVHISECSEWWIDQVINSRKARPSMAENSQLVHSRVETGRFLDAHWQRLERFFASDPSILGKSFNVVGREKEYNLDGCWIFTHLLEHDIHHRSQINQYLRMLEIVPPRI